MISSNNKGDMTKELCIKQRLGSLADMFNFIGILFVKKFTRYILTYTWRSFYNNKSNDDFRYN